MRLCAIPLFCLAGVLSGQAPPEPRQGTAPAGEPLGVPVVLTTPVVAGGSRYGDGALLRLLFRRQLRLFGGRIYVGRGPVDATWLTVLARRTVEGSWHVEVVAHSMGEASRGGVGDGTAATAMAEALCQAQRVQCLQ